VVGEADAVAAGVVGVAVVEAGAEGAGAEACGGELLPEHALTRPPAAPANAVRDKFRSMARRSIVIGSTSRVACTSLKAVPLPRCPVYWKHG
jgi:hypothetical protein